MKWSLRTHTIPSLKYRRMNLLMFGITAGYDVCQT